MILHFRINFSNTTIEQQVDYPNQTQIGIEFEKVDEPIAVEQITMNGIVANRFYNTEYRFAGSDYKQTSVHTIKKPGKYILNIDDLYIRSHRSSTWHCTEKDKDFIYTYEFTRSSFVDQYRDRNHIGFSNKFIPCFGCSFTYGDSQPDTSSWPYLLAKKTGKNFLNLGMASAGPDAIYNNLTLLYDTNPFDQCVILVPPFERRIVHAKIGTLNMRICSNVDLDAQSSKFHFYNSAEVRKQMKSVRQAILRDVDNEYSDRFFSKIIAFCRTKNVDLYCSAWTHREYNYLKQKDGLTLLPAFPNLNIFKERADDGYHPHRKHYEYFVDKIIASNQLK